MAYKVVDLFAGAGGLSLGFMQTGKFKIVAAAENNPGARKTQNIVSYFNFVALIYCKRVGFNRNIIEYTACQFAFKMFCR